jgi:hypothetical protein
MPFNLPAARKAIVIECRKLGLDDATRHDIVRNVGKVASGSTKDMGAEAARRVLNHLRRLAGEANEWAFIDDAIEEKRPLLRKICATCRALGADKAYAEGAAKRQHGIERRLEMMSAAELKNVAAALANTQAHRK